MKAPLNLTVTDSDGDVVASFDLPDKTAAAMPKGDSVAISARLPLEDFAKFKGYLAVRRMTIQDYIASHIAELVEKSQ